jgi:DNA-binding HxlR family transcriptional regulator
MKRTSFEDMNCSLAGTLEVVGEWWTLLILREAMWGTARFDDFQRRLGIARNILTIRLVKLERHGMIARTARDYLLTEKGWALFPSVVALMQWGDDWIHKTEGPPIMFFDAKAGHPIQRIGIRDAAGNDLSPKEVAIRPGPGAAEATRRRAERAQEETGC